MAKQININNNKLFILEDEDLSYIIESGQANAFIAEFDGDVSKYRLFLREVKKGDIIPGLNSVEDGKNYKLFLVNSSRDKNGNVAPLVLSTKKATSKEKRAFVDKIDKYVYDSQYVSDLIQYYLLHQAKDWRNIYTSFSSAQQAQNESFSKIYDAFGQNDPLNTKTLNANDLYFAFEKVARASRIKPVKYSSIELSERSKIELEDLCSLSNCICRKVMLDAK